MNEVVAWYMTGMVSVFIVLFAGVFLWATLAFKGLPRADDTLVLAIFSFAAGAVWPALLYIVVLVVLILGTGYLALLLFKR